MSLFSNIKARVKNTRLKTKLVVAGFTLGIVSLGAVAAFNAVGASPVSTPDCDANAVVWCGASTPAQLDTIYHANGGDGHNTSASIQRVYAHFGIDSSAIDNLKSTYAEGYVTKSGDVYASINGQNTLVATNALTAGRELITSNGNAVAGQTKYDVDGTTFYTRAPSVSFLDDELTAMVSMKDGQFQYAILVSCGNPVTATPKKPNYSIKKTVNGASNVTVKSGSSVNYEIQVASTGAVPVDNVLVRDALPTQNLTVNKNSLLENGKAVSATTISQFFGNGYTIPTLENGSTDTFTFTATSVGNDSYTAIDCAAEAVNNTGYISTTGLSGQSSTATVNTTCETPELACSSLKPAVIGKADQLTGDQSYSFTATATATRANILNYTFDYGDNSTNDVVTSSNTSVTSPSHTYAPGTWTAKVTVTGTENNGQQVTANCTYTVSVSKPATGTLTCNSLSAQAGTTDVTTGDTPYTFTASASATPNATITGYSYSIDNGAPVAGNTTLNHTFAPGSHTVQVTVNGTDLTTNKAITATSKNCVVTINAPQLHPNYKIEKLVSTSANGTYVSDLTGIPTGSTVYYKIVVSSTGDSPVQNVTVSDNAANDIHYNAGTLQQDGTAADATLFFGNGITVPSIKNGNSVTFTFSATVGNTTTDTDPSCMAETLNNTGEITTTTTGLNSQNSTAKVSTTCTELTGSLTCNELTLVPGDVDQTTGNQSYSFTGSATAANAKVTGYSFVVADTTSNKTVATLPGTLSNGGLNATSGSTTLVPGSYKVVMTVTGSDNYGKTLTAPATEKCAATITVSSPSCQPGQTGTYPNCTTPTCQTGQVGTYPNCSTPNCENGQTGTYPNCTTPTCQTGEMGTYPNCTTPPPVLPNTGAGDTIGIFIGAVVAGTVAFRVFLGRKLRNNQ